MRIARAGVLRVLHSSNDYRRGGKNYIGGLVRNINSSNDFGVVVTFSLKDFPQVTLPLDLDPQGGH